MEVYQKKLASGAYELEYLLVEMPTIFDVKIKGNKSFSEQEIKDIIAGLENYQVARPDRLQSFAAKIKEFYVSKGYFLAEVSYSLVNTSKDAIKKREEQTVSEKHGSTPIEIETAKVAATDFVDVIFNINENVQVKVQRISFIGNTGVSSDVLKSHIRTHEEQALSMLTEWGNLIRIPRYRHAAH